MNLKALVFLLSLGLLFMSRTSIAQEDDDEVEEDEDEDDETVEADDEGPVVHRERPVYVRPVPTGSLHFHEPFDTRAEFLKRWVHSQAKKDGADETIAKYDGKWQIEEPRENPIRGDLGLVLKSKAKHHAIATKLDQTFEFNGKPLIAQYEVKFQNGMDCGGAYIKLLSHAANLNLKTFTDKTPYTIMFGPDKCGNDQKLHFIFRHKNPRTGIYEEKHVEKPKGKLESFFTDRKTHLYTLVVNPDNTFEIKVDNGIVLSGNLLENFSPPVNPPKEIQDPNDKKPEDWDDREQIPDSDATKPDDWDESEPATIVDENAVMPDGWLEDEEVYTPDPNAVKPTDWDDEMDGEWEAPRIDNPKCKDAPGCGKWEKPTISNPKYKGKWKAPMIENPDYKGEWTPKMIPNPDYFEDENPYKMTPIGALGLELWSMSDDILFDNFIIADNFTVVEQFTALTWQVKSMEEKASASTGGWWATIKSSTDERPWLWGIYVMVLLLPVALLAICLCPKSGPVKPEDIDNHRKKFDDPAADVIEEVDEPTEEDEGSPSKANEDEDKTEAAQSGGGGDADVSGEIENEDRTNEDSESKETDGSPKNTSPRKRRTRKE